MSNKIQDGHNAKKRYEAKMKKLQIQLNIEKDKDIIFHLEKKPSKQAYVKDLIRKDIVSSK
ncbi:MAG: hypothetical protein NC087_04470 [Anaeroplasma bactoclasticum]|nr:hypothetical protein [Anaeroplasma bactoclasticum]